MEPDSPELWTIGHWVCSEQTFLATLLGAEIDVLADVRAQPGSRRSPHFGIDAMPTWLAAAQIDYVHLPGLAGRRPKQADTPPEVNAGWRNQSFKNYADYSLTAPYADALVELMDLAGERRVCIMCGEPMPWRCHRSLIANSLTARGWTVWHLSTSAAPRRHQLGAWGAEPVVTEDGAIVYPSL